jgi:transcription elongation factor SPT5
LTKRFSDGDHAKVVNGLHRDESGMVIKVDNNIVTLLSDTTLKPIEVFAKDLRSALEATAIIPSTSQYEIHDLVQLG